MTSTAAAGLTYSTETNMLKAAHSEPFSDELIKIRIFILQINNKIADTAEISEERKIRYRMLLLRELTAE